MKKFIVRFLCFFGILFFAIFCTGSFLFYKYLKSNSVSVEPHTILTLNIQHKLHDAPGSSSYLLAQPQLSLRDIADTLQQAAKDKRIEGVVVSLESDVFSGIGQIQEFREIIHKFRQFGKIAIIYADTFGELSTGIASYYFATAFDEIWVQPLGALNISGLKSEVPFIRDFLEDLGIKPEIQTREQYKNAYDSVKESRMTSAHREATHFLLQSLFSQMVRGSAKDRELTETVLTQFSSQSPVLNLKSAVQQGLIDKVIHRIDIEESVNLKLKNKMKFLNFHSYARNSPSSFLGFQEESGPKIAVVFANGMISKQISGHSPLTSPGMEIDRIIDSLSFIERDSKIKAVVLRLNSPGGTVPEGEAIWYALTKMKEKTKKTLIISMADMAASGGYWIATAGDKIMAHPATITGSIGVLMGKIASEKFWQKKGIYWDQVQTGTNFSVNLIHPFTEEQQKKIEKMLDYTYENFIQKVATTRNLSVQHVREIAKGRVWTGEQALERGLVDALGGLDQAIELAETEAKFTESERKTRKIIYLPRVKTLFETLSQALRGEASLSEINQIILAISRNIIQEIKSLIKNIAQVRVEATAELPEIS